MVRWISFWGFSALIILGGCDKLLSPTGHSPAQTCASPDTFQMLLGLAESNELTPTDLPKSSLKMTSEDAVLSAYDAPTKKIECHGTITLTDLARNHTTQASIGYHIQPTADGEHVLYAFDDSSNLAVAEMFLLLAGQARPAPIPPAAIVPPDEPPSGAAASDAPPAT